MIGLKVCCVLFLIVLVTCKSVEILNKNNKFSIQLNVDESSGRSTAGWWQKAVFYQIYVQSFMDSDGDGVGDLRGIINKIDHFTDAGVDAIWLTPIFVSPQVDGGYDVADYRTINSQYGDMNDFMELLETAHNKNLKVILDFVPNHSSDQHVWFNKSVHREPGYEDYYVWKDGIVHDENTTSPPNNWLSVFDGSMWAWNADRKQYYLHQFTVQQPDLNLSNPNVIQELKDIMTYWLDMGVDGFRVDAVPHFVEDLQFRDEPLNDGTTLNPLYDYNALNHIYTKDQNGTFDIIYEFRKFIDNYTKTHEGNERIFMTEAATDIDHVIRYFGTEDGSILGAHFSFNFWFLGMDTTTTPENIIEAITTWKTSLPLIYTQNWLLGNHDNPRVATRVGKRNIDGYNMLTSFIQGVMITYMAEEIGQENGEVTCAQGKDPSAIKNCTTYDQKSRDFERTPFQWDNSTNAGFSNGTSTWLPVSEKYLEINLADETRQSKSHYKVYQTLISLRKLYGVDQTFTVSYLQSNVSNKVLYAKREFIESDSNSAPYYIFVFNLGDNHLTKLALEDDDAAKVEVAASSVNSTYTIGDILDSNDLNLAPGDSLILKPYNITTSI